ncbi:MAG: NUDIX hydrolase [Clostridiales bacterium]|nr:NUDIX hydrolase [Clostridiales bacterium]
MKLIENIISRKKVYQGKIFDVEQRLVTLPNQKEGIYDIVQSADACAIVALDAQGNVILVNQFRQSAEKVLLEIPAGKIDVGEDPDKCAARELQEETGYEAGKIAKLFSIRVSPGFCTEIIHIYKASELVAGKTAFDEDEFIETIKVPLDEAINMIQQGIIEDAKTIAGLLAVDKGIK